MAHFPFVPWSVIVVAAAAAAVTLRVLASGRSLRVRAEIDCWLRDRGLEPQHVERRWLTRGPFPDVRPAGVEHSGLLFHYRGRDPHGAPASGWVWLPPGWQGASTASWRLYRDASPEVHPRGIGSPLFAAALMTAAAVVLAIVSAVALQGA